MKYAKLVRRNLFRNRLRSTLMVLLMSAIFFLVATLVQITVNFDRGPDTGAADRLVVQSAFSLANMLPFAYEEKLRHVDGVVDVCKTQWTGGYYKEPRNIFAILAADAGKLASVFPDYTMDPGEREAFVKDRRGAAVGTDLLERFGWKVGDRITLHRQIFPFDPELTIRAVVHHPSQRSLLWLHMEYFQESIGNWNHCGTFWLRVADPNRMPQISKAIDAEFKNSADPTETFTEKEFNRQFANMMGNIKLLFTSVSVCSIFMVILLAAITMSMAARERVTEIAVLKAIGFPRRLVLSLMLSEAVIATLIGFVLGTGGAALLYRGTDMSRYTMGMLVNFHIDAMTASVCAAAAILVGLLAGGLPSVKAANLSVVDGLRKVV